MAYRRYLFGELRAMNQSFLRCAVFASFGILCFFAAKSNAVADKPLPNIVLILADDYGYRSAGCYGANGELVQTPSIDRLAKEGRRFTDANTTSSVCSPTRYSVLTGRYCWRTTLKHEVLSTFAPLHIEIVPQRPYKVFERQIVLGSITIGVIRLSNPDDTRRLGNGTQNEPQQHHEKYNFVVHQVFLLMTVVE